MMTATAKPALHVAEASASWNLSSADRTLYERIPAKVDCMKHSSFSLPNAENRYYGSDEIEMKVPAWTHFPEVPGDEPVRMKARKSLKPEEEVHLFLRYNYARYRLARLVAAQQHRPTGTRAKRMVFWFRRVMRGRSVLVRANMALVLAMAKRTRIPNVEFNEMISEGNMALLRSVEKFDAGRGFKFSTYACRAILKGFNRMATKTGRYHQRFPTEYDPDLERSDWDEKRHEMHRDSSVDALREILAQNRAQLSDVERRIVMERFGIGIEGKRRTLAEVGRGVGLTNERVRQIQNLALGKIRHCLEEEYLVH